MSPERSIEDQSPQPPDFILSPEAVDRLKTHAHELVKTFTELPDLEKLPEEDKEALIGFVNGALDVVIENGFRLGEKTFVDIALRTAPILERRHGNLEEENKELKRRTGDLTELADKNAKLALTDTLTGLPNKRAFDEAAATVEADDSLSFIGLDIIGFKPVNDTLGYEAGDEALKNAAEIINRVVSNSTYRVGGDEFFCVVPTDSVNEFLELIFLAYGVQRHSSDNPKNDNYKSVETSIRGVSGGTLAEINSAMVELKEKEAQHSISVTSLLGGVAQKALSVIPKTTMPKDGRDR